MMKKIISTIGFILVFAITANAQTAEQPFGFKVAFGSQAYNGDLGNEITNYSVSDHTYTLGLAYYINRYLDVSLELKWMRLDKVNPLNDTVFKKRGTSFATQNLNLNFLLRFKPLQTRLNPYIAVGLGLNFMSDVSEARKDPSFVPLSIPFGIGINYKLIDHVMINIQWLYNRTFSDAIDSYPLSASEAAPGVGPRPNFDGTDHDDFTTLSAGLIFTFGGGNHKEVQPDMGKLYRQSMQNLQSAEHASDEAANTLDQAQQLNDETLAALRKLKNAIGQKPEQSQALKAELIHIVNNIQFAFDESYIIEPAKQELNSLVAILQVYEGLSVELEAYADRRGSVQYNTALAHRRAQSVKDYLVSHGVDASRISISVYGEKKEVYESPTKADQATVYAQNRSVQLTLHYTGTNNME